MQQVITAKWTQDELQLMDDLMSRTGAQSRSQVLRLALLALAEDQAAPPTLVRAACRARLDHPYRRSARATRTEVKPLAPPTPPPPTKRKRR